jgi:hypothetical protein
MALVGGGLIIAIISASAFLNLNVFQTQAFTSAQDEIESRGIRRIDNFNLKFYMPDESWAEADAHKINPDACLVLYQNAPPIYFMIMAGRNPNDPSFTSAELAESLRNGMREKNPYARFSVERSEQYSQLDGLTFVVDGPVEGSPAHYAIWVAERRGFTYELVAYGPKQHTSDIDETLKAMCSRLRQIDPDLVADSE